MLGGPIEPLLAHASRWMAQVIRGYGLREANFGVNFGFVAAKKYGLYSTTTNT